MEMLTVISDGKIIEISESENTDANTVLGRRPMTEKEQLEYTAMTPETTTNTSEPETVRVKSLEEVGALIEDDKIKVYVNAFFEKIAGEEVRVKKKYEDGTISVEGYSGILEPLMYDEASSDDSRQKNATIDELRAEIVYLKNKIKKILTIINE